MTNPGSRARSFPQHQPCPCKARALPGPTFAPSPSWGAVPSAPSPREQTQSSHSVLAAPRALQTRMKGPALPRGGYGPSQSHTQTPEIREASFLPCTGEFVKCLQITLSDHTGTKASDNISLVAPCPVPARWSSRTRRVRSPPSGDTQESLADLPHCGTQQHTSAATSEL